jgi:hypothetical protein
MGLDLVGSPYFDKRKNRWTVTERLAPHHFASHRFHDESDARRFYAEHPIQPEPEEATVSDDTTDVQHLGAVGLNVTPLALSDRAIEHIEALILLDAQEALRFQSDNPPSMSPEEHLEFAFKLLEELRIARDATVSKRDSGMKAVHYDDIPGHGKPEQSEAQRIAGKMAKASRDAVEGESE